MSNKKQASPSINFEEATDETWSRILLKDQEGDTSAEFWIQDEDGGPKGLFIRDTDWDTGIYIEDSYLPQFKQMLKQLLAKVEDL
jgi:hypothetical protein